MKKFLAVSVLALVSAFIFAGCSGHGSSSGSIPPSGGGGSTEVGTAVMTANFNMATSQQLQAAAFKAMSMAPSMAPITHYDLLSNLTNTVASVNALFTSTTTTATYAGSGIVSGGTGTITVSNIRIGSYTMQVDALSAGGSILFTKTQSVTINSGTNNINVALDVVSSFPVTLTITGMPAGTTGTYPVNVSQLLSNGTTTTSTVNGAYDSVTGNLVFTPNIALWPNYATSLTYAIPTFGAALNPDPLTIDVLALIAANHAGTAAYQALLAVNIGIITPTIDGLGFNLVATAGFIGSNSGPAGGVGVRTGTTGLVSITQTGASTDVMLTTNVTAVAAQSTPVTYQCSGYVGTFEIGVAQAASPYADWLTAPVVVTCGGASPVTVFFTPTASGAGKVQFRLGALPAGTNINISLISL